MEWRDKRVKFTKVTRKEDGDSHITTYVIHHARIVSYPDTDKRKVKRSWSFSGLATMVRIMAMYYINIASFLDNPEKDWEKLLEKASHEPPEDDSSRNMVLESCQGTQLALIQ